MLYPIDSITREKRALDGIWKLCFDSRREGVKRKYFVKRPQNLIDIAVPASINEQIIDRKQYNHMDWVWYFSNFIVPNTWKGKRIFIRIGSANYRADVYLNGKKLGSHEGGYMPFEFDITRKVDYSQPNNLTIRIDNLLTETTVPQGNINPKVGGVAAWRVDNWPNVHYDFFPYTGIHRPVVLYATNKSRLEKIRLTAKQINGSIARVNALFECSGRAQSLEMSIKEIGFKQKIKLSRGSVVTNLAIKKIVSWSPKKPRLYDIQLDLINDGEIVDRYVIPFGFRTVRIQKGKVLLNNKPVFFKGFGRHEDINVIGKGLNLPYIVKDYELMEWIGANSYRTSHYPYSEEMMFMADRRGFLVIDETAANTLSMLAVKMSARPLKSLERDISARSLRTLKSRTQAARSALFSAASRRQSLKRTALISSAGITILRGIINAASTRRLRR
jgi:beta-glucuronidase